MNNKLIPPKPPVTPSPWLYEMPVEKLIGVEGGIVRFGKQAMNDIPQFIITATEQPKDLPTWATVLVVLGSWAAMVALAWVIFQ